MDELCHADIQNNYDIPHTKLLTSSVLNIEDYRNEVSMTDTIQHFTYDDFGHITANDRGGTATDMTNTEYVYSADGRRLRTAHKERSMLIGASATMDSIDYWGNLILRNGVPDKYLFDGGGHSLN